MTKVITNIDLGAVFTRQGPAKDELLTFGAAGTVKAGTILAREENTGKLEPFDPGGSDGLDAPKYILPYDVTATAAGDVLIRVPQSGEVIFERLVIHTDGDNSNVDDAIRDQLRAIGFIPSDTAQLSRLDNQ